MDLQLKPAAIEWHAPGGMPPESPLDMPPQDLSYKSSRRDWRVPGLAVLYARIILTALRFTAKTIAANASPAAVWILIDSTT